MPPDAGYRLWVNPESTVLVRVWKDRVQLVEPEGVAARVRGGVGWVEVALRDDPGQVWGPPIHLTEEVVR